ncbi:MAG: hypothetical protein ACI8UP_004165, partial [Porticoccaceae bacterium]
MTASGIPIGIPKKIPCRYSEEKIDTIRGRSDLGNSITKWL